MKIANLYCKDILLGTLFEDGRFNYELYSSYATEINMEQAIRKLELMRQVGLSDTFDFDSYVREWQEFPFENDYRLEIEQI